VTRVTGMTRAIRDNTAPDLRDDPVVHGIATEVARIGADVRALSARVESTRLDPVDGAGRADAAAFGPDAEPWAEAAEPALTAPLEVVRPNSRHWVLIGALLEDIRRVRGELLGEDD